MCKKLWFKLLLMGSALAAAVLWLLTIVMADTAVGNTTFGELNISLWAVLIVSAGWAAAFILMGLFSKNSVTFVKKFQVYIGVACAVIAVITLLNIALPGWDNAIVWPIIAIAIVAGLMLGLIAVGGKSWDQADNQKTNSQPAYKKTEWEKRKEREARERDH